MKLNTKRVFLTGLAFFSICAFWQVYDSIIPKILKYTFGYGETFTGVIMALDNILALFLLPLFGTLSDKVRTRIGKRMPFILIGTTVSVLMFVLLPIADREKNIVLFLVSLGIVLVAMGTYRSPAVALMPDLTPKPLRSKANAIINLMGAAGGIVTLLLVMFMVPEVIDGKQPDYLPLFIAVGAIMAAAVVVLFLTIKENKYAEEAKRQQEEYEKNHDVQPDPEEEGDTGLKMPKDVFRSMAFLLASIFLWFTAYNAVTTAFSRYTEEVWGITGGGFANSLLVATGAAIVSYIPIGIISSKIGRKKTIIGGIIVITICFALGALFSEYHWGIYLIFACTGIAWAAINVNSYPMVVEMSRGTNVGKFTGLYYTFSMAAQTVTPILSGVFLEHVSYRTLFPYAVIFSALSLLTMLMVKHGDSKPIKKKDKLEHFNV